MSEAANINQGLLGACKKAAEWLSGWGSAEPYLSELQEAIGRAEGLDPAFHEALQDVSTHQDAWRQAIQHMLHACAGDEAYWRHELKAFNRTVYALNARHPEKPSKDGEDHHFLASFHLKAFWCSDLKRWVLSRPLSLEYLPPNATFCPPTEASTATRHNRSTPEASS